MALWQFIVIAALLVVVLILISVQHRRIGRTSAALMKIEGALLVTDRLLRQGPAEAAQSRQVASRPLSQPTSRLTSTPTSQPPICQPSSPPTSQPAKRQRRISKRDDIPAYLTIRDLRSDPRGARHRDDTSLTMSPAICDALKNRIARKDLSTAPPHGENLPADARAVEPVETSCETVSPPASLPTAEAPLAATTESFAALNADGDESQVQVIAKGEGSSAASCADDSTSSTPLSGPASGPLEEEILASGADGQIAKTNESSSPGALNDDAEKKRRDTLVFLNSQRRRRRTREGR